MISPLVSVIIPVYNVRPYLREALDSVIGQTYKNLEIIVINDGSTDGSEKICDEYEKLDSRIRLIHQKNLGVSAARNAGLDIMTGNYVAFLDPDDAFNLDMIEKMLNAARENSADVVVCGYDTYYTDEKMDSKKIKPKISFLPDKEGTISRKEALNELIEGKISWAVWNKFFVQNIWKNMRFPVVHVSEEWTLLSLIFEKTNRCFVIKRALVNYRKRCKKGIPSITQTYTLKNFRDAAIARKNIEDYIVKHTPEIFDAGVIERCQEKFFRSEAIWYTKCMSFTPPPQRIK